MLGFASFLLAVTEPAAGDLASGPLSITQCILILASLASCLACIYMVFFFGRRLQTSAYLRESLVEGAKQQELKPLLQELRERALNGPLDPASPPPEGFHSRAMWEDDRFKAAEASPYYNTSETPQEEAARLKREEREAQRLAAWRQWQIDERARFEKERAKLDQTAQALAEKKIPKTMDISLLGGGWSFLLEFSTVIVIIFGILILGITRTLDGREISTILASIAGYVLGKATAGAKENHRLSGPTPSKRGAGE